MIIRSPSPFQSFSSAKREHNTSLAAQATTNCFWCIVEWFSSRFGGSSGASKSLAPPTAHFPSPTNPSSSKFPPKVEKFQRRGIKTTICRIGGILFCGFHGIFIFFKGCLIVDFFESEVSWTGPSPEAVPLQTRNWQVGHKQTQQPAGSVQFYFAIFMVYLLFFKGCLIVDFFEPEVSSTVTSDHLRSSSNSQLAPTSTTQQSSIKWKWLLCWKFSIFFGMTDCWIGEIEILIVEEMKFYFLF